MRKFTTVIIGAGPAGLACAAELAGNGMDVLVVEKKFIIGPKVCGGGITWGGLSRRIPDHLIEKSFHRQHLYTGKQHVTVESAKPIISTVDRGRLGDWMAKEAVNAGAVLLSGTHVREITQQTIEFSSRQHPDKRESVAYTYLVGADGSNSLVRRFLKIPTLAPGVGIDYQLPYSMDEMEWHLNVERFGMGYGWVFPHRRTTSLGIYGIRGILSSTRLLKKLNKWATSRSISLGGVKPRADLINHEYRGWRFDNKLLIGDAAGLASPLTGEGIYPAIVSGEAAARTILQPQYYSSELEAIIRKQKKHRQVIQFSVKNKMVCAMAMEIFALALRCGFVAFDELEMK